MLCCACAKQQNEPPKQDPPAPSSDTQAASPSLSISAFYGETPTFVTGTAAGPASQRIVDGQIALVQSMMPGSKRVADVDIKVADPATWPANAIVYGGAHVNAVVGSLKLPFHISKGRLEIGGETFAGSQYRLITVVPASAGHPEFLLYAGTGTPGIEEINGVPHGPQQIVVADEFGPLATGSWQLQEGSKR
jgi:hypothetical protein